VNKASKVRSLLAAIATLYNHCLQTVCMQSFLKLTLLMPKDYCFVVILQ